MISIFKLSSKKNVEQTKINNLSTEKCSDSEYEDVVDNNILDPSDLGDLDTGPKQPILNVSDRNV